MTKYIVEYLLPTKREWAVYFTHGKGIKTQPMSPDGFLKMDKDRQEGKYIFLSVEVLTNCGGNDGRQL